MEGKKALGTRLLNLNKGKPTAIGTCLDHFIVFIRDAQICQKRANILLGKDAFLSLNGKFPGSRSHARLVRNDNLWLINGWDIFRWWDRA